MRSLTGLFALLLVSLASLAVPPPVLTTFSLHEDFGVSHPDQIVFFEAPPKLDSSRASLVDKQGKAVPFQVMSDGRIAVRTDLPAGAVKTWRLVADQAAAAPGLQITEQPDYVEISNERVGLRVPKAPADLAITPAPIQGLRFQDGIWTAVGPNSMARPAKAMSVEWLDRGPLVARVKIRYTYDKKALHSNLGPPDYPDVPAGEGPYAVTIELQAGQPSILFEEECETDVAYMIDVTKGLNPDKAQYRGHHADSPAQGMETNGAVYSYYGNLQRHDALMNLPYDGSLTDRWSRTSCPFMAHWDPWAFNTGFYWQLYDSRPGGGDNLLGLFAGPPSRLIRPGLSGVSIDTRMTNGQPQVRLQVAFQRFMPTQQYTTRIRFGWGLFLGKTSTDLKPPLEVQAINRQMNLHGGVNLTALQALPADYPDPAAGYGSLYVEAGVWKRLSEQLQTEARTNGHALYNQMVAADHTFKDMLDFWTAPSTHAVVKGSESIREHVRSYLETLVNGEGIYKHETHYFMGASGFSQRLIRLDQLLGSDLIDPAEKRKLKQCAALIGLLLWDNDLAPMQQDAGVNWGPQNMSSMWLGTRYNYTVFLSAHPLFRDRARQVGPLALEQFHDFVKASGACTACAHYTGASMTPILNMLQQLQTSGLLDAFATDPLLKRYAEWEMQLLTPPEVRFGGLRKIIAVGDSSTEFSLRTGQLGTGFAKSDPALSARLMGSWQAMGSPHSAFYGSSQLKVDSGLPAVSPNLGNDQFPGWMSVLRHGWDTTNESAAYFINGEVLSDHRHNDNGALIVYALGAPLSLDWGSMYVPRSDGGLMHSIAVPESGLNQPWDSNNVPLDWPHYMAPWTDTEHRPLASFSNSAAASARFRWPARKDLQWQRTVWSLHSDPAHPVLVVDDVFTNRPGTNAIMISTFNLMAQGEVKTPGGVVLPEERFFSSTVKTNQQLPSAGVPFALAAGLNRFQFTGQWLIDWDLYVQTESPAQAAIGNWGHNWHPSGEANQFAKAQGRPFSERQHILRLRGQDHFRTLILPYRKGEGQSPWRVETQGADLCLQGPDSKLIIGGSHYACQSASCTGLTTFGADPAEAFDIRLQGGPAEVMLAEKTGTLILSGAAGDRSIRLPADWSFSSRRQAAKQKDGQWLVPYEGGVPKTFALVRD
jgi:hypothetical protein